MFQCLAGMEGFLQFVETAVISKALDDILLEREHKELIKSI